MALVVSGVIRFQVFLLNVSGMLEETEQDMTRQNKKL